MMEENRDERFVDPRALSIDQVLADKACRLGDKIFLSYLPDGRFCSYAQLDRVTNQIGNGLIRAGLRPGTHIAVLMENCPEQLWTFLGICKVGAVTVPINTAARGQLLTHFLVHADCAALIVEEHLLHRFLEISATVPRVRKIFVLHGNARDAIEPAAEFSGELLNFSELLDGTDSPPPVRPRFSDLAFLMFTSGTTGPSKANIVTHAQSLHWGLDVARHHGYTPKDVAYVCLPLFHANAFLGSTLGCMMADASIALTQRFSGSRFWKDVCESKATVINIVGAAVNILWKQPPSEDERAHLVRRAHLVPVPGFAHEFEQRFGVKIMSAYGLTDYCMGTAYYSIDSRKKLGTSGRSRHGVDIRIFDEDDLELPSGVPGEIVMRSSNPWCASMGYYKNPEATLASRRNLWFHTGDRGYFDADGYLYVIDRIKDAIRRRGENISAVEVEQSIRSHPAVVDVAVYAVPAESSEDEVAASVVLRPDTSLRFEELIDHCKKNLAYFMVPRYIEIVAELPTNLSLKVEKHKLRSRAKTNLEAFWDREKAGIVLKR